MLLRRLGVFLGSLGLLLLPGCPDSPRIEPDECETDEDCIPADPASCTTYFCATGGAPPPGVCETTPDPDCRDTGVDAPALDTPGDVPLDVPTRDTPEIDAPGIDAPTVDAAADAGPAGVIACPPPPVDVVDPTPDPAGVFDPIAVLCGIRSSCFLTTATGASFPPDPRECSPSVGGLTHATTVTGDEVLIPLGPWRFVAADVRVAPGAGQARLRTGASSTVVVEHTGGERFSVVLDARPGAALWRSVAPYAAPAPRFGEAFACLGEPHDFVTSVPSAVGDVFVRVCDERGRFGICTVHGDVEGSPEAEGCDAYALELGYLTSSGAPYVRTVGGTSYDIATASHGTISGTGGSLTGQPVDTDVTFTAGDGTSTLEVVARWAAGRVTASVVAR